MDYSGILEQILLIGPVLLFSVIAHEYAHGYAALRQGDQTALMLGRLTFNPIKHIDPYMTILLPAVLLYVSHGTMMLGGAKPVPVNPRNYRNYRRGDIIVSLAGVATNFVLALLFTVALALCGLLGAALPVLTPSLSIMQQMMFIGVYLNLLLIAFNLIPIPPLDGSHVAKYLLPPAWAFRYAQLRFGGLAVIVLLLWVAPSLLNVWLAPAYLLGNVLVGAVSHLLLTGVGLGI